MIKFEDVVIEESVPVPGSFYLSKDCLEGLNDIEVPFILDCANYYQEEDKEPYVVGKVHLSVEDGKLRISNISLDPSKLYLVPAFRALESIEEGDTLKVSALEDLTVSLATTTIHPEQGTLRIKEEKEA